MNRLDGKVAIVTGGASGIGRATAGLFALENADVILADIDADAGELAAAQIQSQGLRASFHRLDVADQDSWSGLIHRTESEHGHLDILVNNAGISLARDIEETTLDDWNALFAVNATGTFLGTRSAIAAMKKNDHGGSIINRSSVDGQVGEAGLFAYCASKGAVTLLTKSAALSCGQKGYQIRVNSVHPGYIRTPLMDAEARGYGITIDEYVQGLATRHPIGSIGEPRDVANLDLFLASDESRWITGAEFTVDGGYTAQ